jgi:hypothetical protein
LIEAWNRDKLDVESEFSLLIRVDRSKVMAHKNKMKTISVKTHGVWGFLHPHHHNVTGKGVIEHLVFDYLYSVNAEFILRV